MSNKQRIVRVQKTDNYSVICNKCLRDDRLSWKAKGLLAYILTLPNDWKIYAMELKNHAKDGIDSTTAGMKELKKHGYLTLKSIKDERGRIIQWVYTVYEESQTPQMAFPVVENHSSGLPDVEKPTLLNTNNTKYLEQSGLDEFRIKLSKLFEKVFARTIVFNDYSKLEPLYNKFKDKTISEYHVNKSIELWKERKKTKNVSPNQALCLLPEILDEQITPQQQEVIRMSNMTDEEKQADVEAALKRAAVGFHG